MLGTPTRTCRPDYIIERKFVHELNGERVRTYERDPPHQRTSSESRSTQREREYILREVAMPCHRLERRSVCRCRVWDSLLAGVSRKASLWSCRQFEISGDCAYVRVNTG